MSNRQGDKGERQEPARVMRASQRVGRQASEADLGSREATPGTAYPV